MGSDTPQACLRFSYTRSKAARVGHQPTLQHSQQMHGVSISPIYILKNAGLLDNKHFTAQLKHGIKLSAS